MSTLLSSPLSLRGAPAPGVLSHGVNPTVDDDSRVVGERVLASADWLSLSELTYVDQSGQQRTWEAVMRVTRAPGSTVDSVTVLALYRRLLHYDCLLLVKQYRPALRAHTIELPSGLVLPGESPEQSAEREVRECAGFEGVARKAGPVLAADPTASGCAMRIVTVEINGDDPGNNFINTRAAGDRLKVPVLVPISELPERLRGFASAGFIVDSRLDSFAIGLSMGGLGARRAKTAAPPV